MKTLVIVMGLLAVTTSVYGFDRERLKKYYTNLEQCTKEIGRTLDKFNPEAILCACERDGKLMNEKGEFIRDAVLKVIEDAISNQITIKQAQDRYNKCHDEAEASRITGHDQALKILICAKPNMDLIEKL